MKLFAALSVVCSLGLCSAAAQERFVPLEEWDYTAFCSYTDLHPMQAVRADNNWQLLWALRRGGTPKELTERGIPHTRSQLLLLRTQRLLSATEDGRLKTAAPILDSLATTQLRTAATATAAAMYHDLTPELQSFCDFLAREGFGGNAFSLLFSYVIDGTIWGEFERREIVRYDDNGTGVWSGCLWFSYPPSKAFRPGTNTLSLGGRYALHVNWAAADPAFAARIYDKDTKRFFRLLIAHEALDDAAVAAARDLGLWDGRRATIPVIRRNGPLAKRARRLTRELCEAFLRHADIGQARELAGCDNDTDAALICYHEVMWQLGERVLAGGMVRLPHLFADPADARPADMAEVCFITID